MLSLLRSKRSNMLAWLLLVPLIIGLAGFGISDMLTGGFSTTVAEVGERTISAETYARALSRELRGASEQAGRQVTMAEARSLGLDRSVLSTLTRRAALEAEAERLGFMASEDAVAAEIAAIPAFRGPDGAFSRDQARLVLGNAGVTERELAEDTRAGLARGLIEAAVAGDMTLPPALLSTILTHRLETRSLRALRFDPERFGGVPEEPTAEELAAHHAAEAARFTLPETRVVTHALIDPAALAAGIEVPEAEIRARYDERIASFRTPERRSVSRLTFPSAEEAEAAKARIAAGEATLAALAAERGFTEANIALGEVTAAGLGTAEAAAVFGLPAPGLAGPVATDLGPALFEVHAILAATETPFEAAREGLRAELALTQARDLAAAKATQVEDLIAGGARIEEIAKEAGLAVGRLEVPLTGPAEGLAADPKLRALIFGAKVGTELDIAETSAGLRIALRVDEVRPERLPPVEEIAGAVRADLVLQRKRVAAEAAAASVLAAIRAGVGFEEAAARLGLAPVTAGPVRRDQAPPGLPAALLPLLFAAAPGEIVTASDAGGTVLAELTGIASFDPLTPENSQIAGLYQQTLDQSYAADIALYHAIAVEARQGVRVVPATIEATLSQIP